jgi:hypothetical protein
VRGMGNNDKTKEEHEADQLEVVFDPDTDASDEAEEADDEDDDDDEADIVDIDLDDLSAMEGPDA